MENKTTFSFERNNKSKKAKPVEGYITDRGCYVPTTHKWTDGKGYPKLQVDGVGFRMCRWVFMNQIGELRKDEIILHSCDNPNCISPFHLRKGSHQENMTDMVSKGRQHKGRVPEVPLDVAIDIMSDWRSALQLSKIHNLSPARALNIQKRKIKKYQKIYEMHLAEIEEKRQLKLLEKANAEAEKKTPENGALFNLAA